MKARARLTKSDKIQKATQICEAYAKGIYTIKACCEAAGVDYSTFQHWAQVNLSADAIRAKMNRRGFVHEVHELYKDALVKNEFNFKALLKDAARQALLIRLTGLEYDEVQTVEKPDKEGNNKQVKKIIKTKRALPDITAIIFTLKSLDSENFKEIEHKKVEITTGFEHFSLEELSAKRIELYNILNSPDEL
jgi:hypothetical protein